MEEKDFQRIEQLIGKVVKAEVENVTKEMTSVRSDVVSGKEDIKTLQAQLGSFKEEIKDEFRLQAGILSEDFQHKLQLVAEGHQMLAEKMDRTRDELGNKIDAVSMDIAAHRADTEGHKRGYMVKEP
jgi:septal ring factor EnvC (AmiA/AmiB activator)